ncbi:MAG TPA: STAS domain-containing protein [Sedimenticola thiotaurini]|uniref:STAS domain-containing protein n=1 Tax=Sedimenticola thiotaurini TaxID=1543721 RepID=A0A831RLD9_9GAMM|nr:STAS domain-containing protein [Sedimenticola thiotaurini]
MSGARIVKRQQDELRVEGDLVFETVGPLLSEGVSLFGGGSRITIDLAGVGAIDSAGVALLLEWLSRARERGCSIAFRDVPDALWRIARLSNLDSLLPVAD